MIYFVGLSGNPIIVSRTLCKTPLLRCLSLIPFQSGDVILTDNDDFISNQIQFLSCRKRFDIEIVRIKNASEGGVDLEDLERKLVKLQPRLLAITHIPTNSGLVQPVKQIGEIYQRYTDELRWSNSSAQKTLCKMRG